MIEINLRNFMVLISCNAILKEKCHECLFLQCKGDNIVLYFLMGLLIYVTGVIDVNKKYQSHR